MLFQAILIMLVYSICYGSHKFPYRDMYKTNTRDTCSSKPYIKDLELVYNDKDKKKYTSKRNPKKLVHMTMWDMFLYNLGLNTAWDSFKGVSYKDGTMSIRTQWYIRHFFSTGYSNGEITLKPKWRNIICLGVVVLVIVAIGLVTGMWFFVLGAAFTSKANGLFSAAGQTTWNEVGFPGTGDTAQVDHHVTIQGTEACGNIVVNDQLTFDGQSDGTPAIMNIDNGSSIANSGVVDQLNTGSTGYAAIVGNSAEPMTGSQITFGNGHWKFGQIDFQMDITTGGGTCVFEFVDDCTLDNFVCSANDTVKCVTAGTTLTQGATSDFHNSGTIDFQGTGGGHITLNTDLFIPSLAATADITIDYLDVSGTHDGMNFQADPAACSIQNSTFTTSAGNRAGIKLVANVDVSGISNCTFSGGDDATYARTDISLLSGATLELDTCTFTTVGMEDTDGWIVHMTSGTLVVWGILPSSETPSAGYRAADITGNLTLSQADQYLTSFDTSYTLGANLPNVDDITIDVDTTLVGSTRTITASGDIDNQGTYTPNTSTFIMNGANQSITGSWTFYDLTQNNTSTTMGAALVVSNDLTITGGNLNTSDGTDWDLTVTNTTSIVGTLTCNASTISLGSGLVAGSYSLGLSDPVSVFDGGTGTHTIGSIFAAASCNLTLTSGTTTIDGFHTAQLTSFIVFTPSVSFTSNGGEVIFTYPGATALASIDGSAMTFYDVTINNAACVLRPFDGFGVTLTVSNDFTITSGEYNSAESGGVSRDVTVTGNLDNQDTFTPNNSLVTLNGATQSLTGSWTFYNFTKSVIASDTLTFENGETYTFGGNVTIKGAAGNLLSLVSDAPGTSWAFTMSTGANKTDLSFLDVADSDASGSDASQKPIDPSSSTDSGGTTDWFPVGAGAGNSALIFKMEELMME